MHKKYLSIQNVGNGNPPPPPDDKTQKKTPVGKGKKK